MNRVISTRNLSADIDTVWALAADVTSVVHWHPKVKSVDLLSPHKVGIGAARRCNFYDGTSVVEEVTQQTEGRALKIVLSEFSLPMKTFEVDIALKSIATGGTQIVFTMNYEMKWGVLGTLMNAMMVRGQMAGLMKDVLDGMEHHLQTGEEVGEHFQFAA